MALEMKSECKACGEGLDDTDECYICTHECTYCPACRDEADSVCPACNGELVRRPRPAQ